MFIPHTAQEQKEMLARIGVSSVRELLEIPAGLLYPKLNLPAALTEPELAAHIKALGAENKPQGIEPVAARHCPRHFGERRQLRLDLLAKLSVEIPAFVEDAVYFRLNRLSVGLVDNPKRQKFVLLHFLLFAVEHFSPIILPSES